MEALNRIDLRKVLVMDIETVSAAKSYNELSDDWKKLWQRKAQNIRKSEDESDEELYERAGIYSEFGKVISICCGVFALKGKQLKFHVKAFSGDDEKAILLEFAELLNEKFNSPDYRFCAHNGREFDIPYLCRRMIINQIPLPAMLDMSAKKPWEVPHIDTMELWKFGDYKAFTSLNLLSAILGVPSPKDDIDGSMVGKVYWEDNDLKRINDYCIKDIITTARVLLRLMNKEFFGDEDVVYS
jgi:3'-5' exonuclease